MITHQIVEMKLKALKPAPYNPRSITNEAFKGLSASIDRFGLVQPIVWNKQTGHVVGGHQRVAALIEKGIESAQCVVVDLPEAEEQALNVTLNNPQIAGEFTDDLQAMLDQMKTSLPDGTMDQLGLTALLESLSGMGTATPGLTDPDAVPEPPDEPITKLGDIWKLGDHRVMCGDATKKESASKLLDGEVFSFVFTSPPYNAATDMSRDGNKVSMYVDPATDSKTSSEYIEFNRSVFQTFHEFGDADVTVCYNVGYNKNSPAEFIDVISDANRIIPLRETIVWEKAMAITLMGDNLTRICEFIFVFSKAQLNMNKAHNECQKNLWEVNNIGANLDNHKACFPVELPRRGIELFSITGNVYEPFGGSGSTLIACEQTNRRCFMMELSPAYCDVIVKRWENFTGKKATLEKV